MMIGEISFCDQIGFNIKTDETKRFILDMLQRKYGLKIITKHFVTLKNSKSLTPR